jgi:hypothetical protein
MCCTDRRTRDVGAGQAAGRSRRQKMYHSPGNSHLEKDRRGTGCGQQICTLAFWGEQRSPLFQDWIQCMRRSNPQGVRCMIPGPANICSSGSKRSWAGMRLALLYERADFEPVRSAHLRSPTTNPPATGLGQAQIFSARRRRYGRTPPAWPAPAPSWAAWLHTAPPGTPP